MLGRMSGAARRSAIGRPVRISLALLLALATCALTGPVALAAAPSNGNAFQELTERQGETGTTARTATGSSGSTSSQSSNSQVAVVLAGVAALALLIGIAFVIARDARKVAPAGDPELTAEVASRDWAGRQRKRRAKAKAARQQRKRNR
jgi:ABC-type Fe3+-hydroxamate transport system substrate-binding protein